MRIVLDTNILWDKAAMRRLRNDPAPKVLPAVALAERARQYHSKGRSLAGLWAALETGGVEVESLDRVAALRFSIGVLDDGDWERLARDALIAGHVGPDDVLWTRDVEDFLAVGLPPHQIVDPSVLHHPDL